MLQTSTQPELKSLNGANSGSPASSIYEWLSDHYDEFHAEWSNRPDWAAFANPATRLNLPIPYRGSATLRNGTLPRTSGSIAPNRSSRRIIKQRQMLSAPILPPQLATASQQLMLLFGALAILIS